MVSRQRSLAAAAITSGREHEPEMTFGWIYPKRYGVKPMGWRSKRLVRKRVVRKVYTEQQKAIAILLRQIIADELRQIEGLNK
jgi:hypothetical protein